MQQYHRVLKLILAAGDKKEAARAGMPGTLSMFGEYMKFDLSNGFPIQTTKQVNFSAIVTELLWFLSGDTNIKYLVDHGVNIWNEDAYNYYLKKCKDQNLSDPMNFDTFVGSLRLNDSFLMEGIKKERSFPNDYVWGDCGYQYGQQWRGFGKGLLQEIPGKNNHMDSLKILEGVDQITNVINSLLKNPFGRRHIVTVFDPVHENDLALYWCHGPFQFNCRLIPKHTRYGLLMRKINEINYEYGSNVELDSEALADKLNVPKYCLDLQAYQRSADIILGVPYNISSYALLTHIIAKITNMIPGEYTHIFGDVHCYENHIEEAKEILSRDFNKYKLPELKISGILNEYYRSYKTSKGEFDPDILNMIFKEDFVLENYQSYPAVKAKLNTGLR